MFELHTIKSVFKFSIEGIEKSPNKAIRFEYTSYASIYSSVKPRYIFWIFYASNINVPKFYTVLVQKSSNLRLS